LMRLVNVSLAVEFGVRMLLRKQAVTVNRFQFVGAIGQRPQLRQSNQSYAALACVLGLSAIALAPLTPVGKSAGDMIASRVDLAFFHSGRQQLAEAAVGLIAARSPGADSAATQVKPVETHNSGLSALRTVVAGLSQPTIGLSAPLSIQVPGAEGGAPSKADTLEPLQFFRRIAGYGLTNEVDFAPTATTGSLAGERLPPLAHLTPSTAAARRQIAIAAGGKGSRKAKPELSAAPVAPGKLFSGPLILRSALPGCRVRSGAQGRCSGPV
jgi:hypothetical protein